MKATTVYVTVSLGAKKIRLFDVTGQEERAAVLQLERSGFRVTRSYEVSEAVTKGYVVSMSPDKDTELKSGDIVNIVVSLGPEEIFVTVPSLLGFDRDDVQRELERHSLIFGEFIVTDTDDETKDGLVYDQSIEPETEVLEKTVVDVYIYEFARSGDETSPDDSDSGSQGSGSKPMGTYSLNVKLDNSADISTVRIEAMGEVRYEANYLSSYGTVQVTLTGTGSEIINIYVNDVFMGSDIAVYD